MATAAEIYAQAQADALRKQLESYYGNYENTYQNRYNQLNSIANQNLANLLSAFNSQKDYLTSSFNSQKDYLTNLYNNQTNQLKNQANTNIGIAKEDYMDDARQMYVNKVQSGNVLQNQLNRLNLDTTGFGVGEMVDITNQYSRNLGLLKDALNDTTRDINNTLQNNLFKLGENYNSDLFNAQQTYDKNIASLLQNYNANVADINAGLMRDTYNLDNEKAAALLKLRQSINEQVQDAYNAAFNQYMKQNPVKTTTSTSNNRRNNKNSGSTTNLTSLDKTNSEAIRNKSNYYWKKSDGSYTDQPSYVYNKRLTKTGKVVKDLFTNQKHTSFGKYTIWKGIDANGKTAYYVWDNKIKDYVDITNQYTWVYDKGHKVEYEW